MDFRSVGFFSQPSPLSLSECKERRLCVLNFRFDGMGFLVEQSWEVEFLNPEGAELPPPPPPPMIPSTVVMLVAEEKPPKLIPMARPDDGTKGQMILTNDFKGAVNKSYGEKELLTVAVTNHFRFFLKSKQEQYGDGEEITCSEYFAVYKTLPVCDSADFRCITVVKLKKPADLPLEDNECDCTRNLQRDGVEPLLNASTTMTVKHGHVLDLLTASQIDWIKSWKVKIKKQADVQGHGHGQGGPMAIGGGGEGGVDTPRAGFAQGEGRGRGGRRGGRVRQLGPLHRHPIVYGQRRSNRIDLMREYHDGVTASLRYVLTLYLQQYVSVEDMISHIRTVVDNHGVRALTVLHRITFMMRQNGQIVRCTVQEARTTVWDRFSLTVQSVEIIFRVAGTVEVNIHGRVRQLARREIPTLTELVNWIRLWGAVDGDRERFEVLIAGQVIYYDFDEIETYSHREGWRRAVIALRGVRVSR